MLRGDRRRYNPRPLTAKDSPVIFGGTPVRPVFVLDVSERAIDLLSRERFIDDYCNVLTANGRHLPEPDEDEDPEETDKRLYMMAVTEIQKDPAIRIADTAASLTIVIAQYYREAVKKAQTPEDYEKAAKNHLEILDELSIVLRKLAAIRRAEKEGKKPSVKEFA